MPRDNRLYIDDMLEAIRWIESYVIDLDFPTFTSDRKTNDAVVFNLEVIGEAARRLPDELKSAAPEIEWRKIVDLRNILVHEYFGINHQVIWDIIHTKLQPLKAACEKLMGLSE
jgi:uncharacterized protein with HEPN domain